MTNTCPTCGSVSFTYRRKLNSGMAKALLDIVKEHLRTGDWVNIRNIGVRGGDYAKLCLWGLLVRGKPGYWKPTELGMDFALLKKAVPAYVLVDKGKRVGVSSDLTTINSALGRKFSYIELMRGFSPYSPQVSMEV